MAAVDGATKTEAGETIGAVAAIDETPDGLEEALDGYDDPEGDDESSFADELVDDLLPTEFDWRRVVRRYPLPSLLIAALGGYLLGRSRGQELVEALGEAAGDHVSARLSALTEDELL